MNLKKYLQVTQEQGKAFVTKQIEGRVTMLNLLKFKDEADYDKFQDLAPKIKITGKEAYQKYIDHSMPFMEKAGSKVLYYGKGQGVVIGPDDESWDAIMLVQHESVKKFLKFAEMKEYLKGAGHRTAALLDSRLMPFTEM